MCRPKACDEEYWGLSLESCALAQLASEHSSLRMSRQTGRKKDDDSEHKHEPANSGGKRAAGKENRRSMLQLKTRMKEWELASWEETHYCPLTETCYCLLNLEVVITNKPFVGLLASQSRVQLGKFCRATTPGPKCETLHSCPTVST